jgi:membrane protease YdiL (CAAX protease family)
MHTPPLPGPTPGLSLGPLLAEPWLIAGLAAIASALVYAVFSTITARRRARSAPDTAALATMTETILLLWALGSVCLGVWLASGRTLAELGLGWPELAGAGAWRGWLSWGAATALIAWLLSQMLALRSPEGREAMAKALGEMDGVDLIQPRTPQEHRRFQLMALSAGWNEEIVFRGFLIGTLALIAPVWLAAGLAGIVFIGFHAYQGVSGMIRIIPITIGMTGLVLLSGSLWPAILVHVAADAVGGICLYLCRPATDRLSPAAP